MAGDLIECKLLYDSLLSSFGKSCNSMVDFENNLNLLRENVNWKDPCFRCRNDWNEANGMGCEWK